MEWRRVPKLPRAKWREVGMRKHLVGIGGGSLWAQNSIQVWSRERMLCPAGIAMAACWRDPNNFWNVQREVHPKRQVVWSLPRRLVTLSWGSSIVRASPSKIHPRISFQMAHTPSPLRILERETGSPPGWPVTSAGGKTVWIPCRRALKV